MDLRRCGFWVQRRPIHASWWIKAGSDLWHESVCWGGGAAFCLVGALGMPRREVASRARKNGYAAFFIYFGTAPRCGGRRFAKALVCVSVLVGLAAVRWSQAAPILLGTPVSIVHS